MKWDQLNLVSSMGLAVVEFLISSLGVGPITNQAAGDSSSCHQS